MAPATPPLLALPEPLGPEAAVMVAAIKAVRDPDVRGLRSEVGNVSTKRTSMDLKVDMVGTRMDAMTSRSDRTDWNVQDL
eukprot:7755893-Pyramimonas_sp.AAC.1